MSSPAWLPFELGFEERGERLRVDLEPAHAVLERAFSRLPGSSLTDAEALVRSATHTAYALRGLANDEGKGLVVDARDLELRERASGASDELAPALQFLSQTPRGRAIAAEIEERLVRRAPFVMRDLHQLDVRDRPTPPLVFWQGTEPCLSWADSSRCNDASPVDTRGLERGESLRHGQTVKLLHAAPRTIDGDSDDASATLVDGDRRWLPAHLIVSTRGTQRFWSAPSDIILAPSGSAGVVLVPIYGAGTCTRRSKTIGFGKRLSCNATFRIQSYEVWAFSTTR